MWLIISFSFTQTALILHQDNYWDWTSNQRVEWDRKDDQCPCKALFDLVTQRGKEGIVWQDKNAAAKAIIQRGADYMFLWNKVFLLN